MFDARARRPIDPALDRLAAALARTGLGANAVAGWWWADPVAALFMVPWLIMEGREGIRGEECCDGD